MNVIVVSCLLSLKHKQQASSWARLLFSGRGKIGRDFIFLDGEHVRHTESPCAPCNLGHPVLHAPLFLGTSPVLLRCSLLCDFLLYLSKPKERQTVGHRWYYRRASIKTGLCSRQGSLLCRNTLFHSTFSLEKACLSSEGKDFQGDCERQPSAPPERLHQLVGLVPTRAREAELG